MSSSNIKLSIDFHAIITSRIAEDTSGITKDFYKGYQDYYNVLMNVKMYPLLEENQVQITSDDNRLFWLQNAIEINSNNAVQNPDDPNGLSNTYIRSVTRSGLLYDLQATQFNVNQKVQSNSDTIAKYVLGDLYGFKNGRIPPSSDGNTLQYDYTKLGKVPGINEFVKDDIQSAITDGNQTVATWGGSFYYWDVSLTDGTIGQDILDSPRLYEEFLAVNAKAAADTRASPGAGIFTGLGIGLTAQAPLSVKVDIFERMLYGKATGNWNGDPNQINGYTASLDSDGHLQGWLVPTTGGWVNVGDVPSLDTIRDIRLSAPTDWYGGSPVQNQNRAINRAEAPADRTPQILDPVALDENGSVGIDNPSGSIDGPETFVTSGDGRPIALGGTVTIVDGRLIYTPDQDVVGRDYITFETSDGETTTDWVVPVTIRASAHDTTTSAPDGSVRVEHFDNNGIATFARTDALDGTYTLSNYAVAAGTTYVAVTNYYDQNGLLLEKRQFQADGTAMSDTVFGTVPDGDSTVVVYDGQGTLKSSTLVHANGSKEVVTYLHFSDANANKSVDTTYDAQGGLIGQTFKTAYGWTYASGSAYANADGSYSETVSDNSGIVIENDIFFSDGSRDAKIPVTGEFWSSSNTHYSNDGRIASRQLLLQDGSIFLAGISSYDLFGDTTITYAANADGTTAVETVSADGSSELIVNGIVGQSFETSDSVYDDTGRNLSRTLSHADGSTDRTIYGKDWLGANYLLEADHTDSSGLETSSVIYNSDGSISTSSTTVREIDGTLTTTVRNGGGNIVETVTTDGAVKRTTRADGSIYVEVATGGSYQTRGDEVVVYLSNDDTLQASASGAAIVAEGSGNLVVVTQAGNTFAGSGNTIDLSSGASFTVVGSDNEIFAGTGDLFLAGARNVVHFDAASVMGTPTITTMSAKTKPPAYIAQSGDILDLTSLKPEDGAFSHDGTDLIIKFAQGATIDVVDEFGPSKVYDGLTFADGSSWTSEQIASAAGYAVNPGFFYGSSQEDDVSPGLIDTTFDLGRGDDHYTEALNEGNTFDYSSGDGNDVYTISGTAPSTDTLRLTDLHSNDVSLTRDGSDLVVTDVTTGETVTIAYQFYAETSGVASIEFADGSTWNRDVITARSPIRGTNGNDSFQYVNYTNSTIDLGKGDDAYSEYGAQGDNFVYRSGDGNDTYSLSFPIVDNSVLQLVDLDPSEVSLLATGYADTDLILTDLKTGQTIKLNGELYDLQGDTLVQGVSRIDFADGTSWDRAEMAANAVTNDQVISTDDTAALVTSDVTVLVTGARDSIDVQASAASVKVRGTDATVTASYKYVDFLDDSTGTVVGTGDEVRLRANSTVTLSGSYHQALVGSQGSKLYANNAYVTALSGATASLYGDHDTLVLRDNVGFSLAGQEDDVTVVGSNGTLTLGGVGHNVDIGGDNEILTFNGEASVTSSGKNETFVFSAQSGSTVISGFDASDIFQFSKDLFTDWQNLLEHASQTGADATITLAGSATILLRNVDLSVLTADRFRFVDPATTPPPPSSLVFGTDGADYLDVTQSGVTIDAGLGDDYISHKDGETNQTYLYASGDGNDTIDNVTPTGATDVLKFTNLNASDVRLSLLDTYHLAIETIATGQTITVLNQFGDDSGTAGIGRIVFADGSSLDQAGISSAAWLRGTSGNDYLYVPRSGMTVDGGLGDDEIEHYNGESGETYVYAQGDGNDTIYTSTPGGTSDILKLSDMTANDVTLTRSGDDLLVTTNGNGQVVTVMAEFEGAEGERGVAAIAFADGTTMDRTALTQAATVVGTSGNDYFDITSSNVTIDGMAGDDYISHKDGETHQTYLYASGDGNDTIDNVTPTGATDALKFTDLNASDVRLSISDTYNLSIETIATGQTITVLNQFGDGSGTAGIGRIDFADGSGLDQAGIQSAAWLRGTGGDDYLYVPRSEVTVDGGPGDDEIDHYNGESGETFVYAHGDGNDTISAMTPQGSSDVLSLTDLNRADVVLSHRGNDLIVGTADNGEAIRIKDQFTDSTGQYGLASVKFADGSSLDRTALDNAAWYRAGDDATVDLTAYDDGATLEAGAGSDTLHDAYDNGTFVYGSANGNLGIEAHTASPHFDTLNLTDLNPSDLTFSQNGSDLLIGVNATSHAISIAGEFNPGEQDGVQQIAFANGTKWDQSQIAAAAQHA